MVVLDLCPITPQNRLADSTQPRKSTSNHIQHHDHALPPKGESRGVISDALGMLLKPGSVQGRKEEQIWRVSNFDVQKVTERHNLRWLVCLGLVALTLGMSASVVGEFGKKAETRTVGKSSTGHAHDNWSRPRHVTRRHLRDREVHEAEVQRRLMTPTMGVLGISYDLKDHEGLDRAEGGAPKDSVITEGTVGTPPVWDSTLCMHHWGVPQLQEEIDPNGYLIYVSGREQLGGNKYLVSDGLFIAKSLGRTFVEYPVKDARVSSFGEAEIGLGAYWDLSELCMYHRILDLSTFRTMVSTGVIPGDDIVTLTSDTHEFMMNRLQSEEDIKRFFKEYKSKVIVLEYTWKSGLKREPLEFLRPNAFYMGVVRMLLEEQKDWDLGNFIAVQWRTETATGDLDDCYQQLKRVIEEQREALGLGTHQVLFNTDLYGQTSGTYADHDKDRARDVLASIMVDYPEALDNKLHKFFIDTEDAGVRAFVSGLAVASARVMIASSLNDHDTSYMAEALECQKPYSGYIHLIAEWRNEITYKDPDTTINVWPIEVPDDAGER